MARGGPTTNGAAPFSCPNTPRRFALLSAIVIMSVRSDMMIKLLFCFLLMKVFSCSALSSCSFRFSLSASVFCSSVALLRKSPYCSYKWHIRAITPSYRQDKRNAPFRPALRYPMRCRYSDRLAPRPVPSYRRGGAFFHLIGSSRISSAFRIVSSRLVPRVG